MPPTIPRPGTPEILVPLLWPSDTNVLPPELAAQVSARFAGQGITDPNQLKLLAMPEVWPLVRRAIAFFPVLQIPDLVARIQALTMIREDADGVRHADQVLAAEGAPTMRVGAMLAEGALALVGGDVYRLLQPFALKTAFALSPVTAWPTVKHYLMYASADPRMRVAAAEALASEPHIAEGEVSLIVDILRQDPNVNAAIGLFPVLPHVSWGHQTLQDLVQMVVGEHSGMSVVVVPAHETLKAMGQVDGIEKTTGMRSAIFYLEAHIRKAPSGENLYLSWEAAKALSVSAVPMLERVAEMSVTDVTQRQLSAVETLGKMRVPPLDSLLRLARSYTPQIQAKAFLALKKVEATIIAERMVQSGDVETQNILRDVLIDRLQKDRDVEAARAVLIHLDNDFFQIEDRPGLLNDIRRVNLQVLAQRLAADYVASLQNGAVDGGFSTETFERALTYLGLDAIDAVKKAVSDAFLTHANVGELNKGLALLQTIARLELERAEGFLQQGGKDERLGREILNRAGGFSPDVLAQLVRSPNLRVSNAAIDALHRLNPARALMEFERLAQDSGCPPALRERARMSMEALTPAAILALRARAAEASKRAVERDPLRRIEHERGK